MWLNSVGALPASLLCCVLAKSAVVRSLLYRLKSVPVNVSWMKALHCSVMQLSYYAAAQGG